VILFDSATAKELVKLDDELEILDFAFHPDSKTLVSFKRLAQRAPKVP
jgi:hypothetical protein